MRKNKYENYQFEQPLPKNFINLTSLLLTLLRIREERAAVKKIKCKIVYRWIIVGFVKVYK